MKVKVANEDWYVDFLVEVEDDSGAKVKVHAYRLASALAAEVLRVGGGDFYRGVVDAVGAQPCEIEISGEEA